MRSVLVLRKVTRPPRTLWRPSQASPRASWPNTTSLSGTLLERLLVLLRTRDVHRSCSGNTTNLVFYQNIFNNQDWKGKEMLEVLEEKNWLSWLGQEEEGRDADCPAGHEEEACCCLSKLFTLYWQDKFYKITIKFGKALSETKWYLLIGFWFVHFWYFEYDLC